MNKADTWAFIGPAFFLLASAGAFAWFASAQCTSRWERSGLRSDWGPIQGCMVERRDGTWVPDESIRELAP